MPYDASYKRRVQMLSFMAWYEAEDLAKEIKMMRTINFSIVEQRQQSLQRLGNMETTAPYGKNVRFPEEKMYVCEAVGDWSRKMQQLKSALSYKPLDKDDKAKAGGEGKSIDDPSQAFWNATTSMLNQLMRLDGVFDREAFEKLATWQEPTAHGGAGGGGGNQGGGNQGSSGGGNQGSNTADGAAASAGGPGN